MHHDGDLVAPSGGRMPYRCRRQIPRYRAAVSTPSPKPSSTPDADRWNNNIQYHSVIFDAIPMGTARTLDVGCGEGLLTRQLGDWVTTVIGVDIDVPSIGLAQRTTSAHNVRYVLADAGAAPFASEVFDAVVSVAALHHMDMRVGLTQMARVLRPGGVLAMVGLARSRRLIDLPRDLVAAAGTRIVGLRRSYWEHSAPMVWPPPETFAACRRIAEATLPGVRYRRHLFWRYSLVWTKPDW